MLFVLLYDEIVLSRGGNVGVDEDPLAVERLLPALVVELASGLPTVLELPPAPDRSQGLGGLVRDILLY
jgi:hypothetical protein